MDKQSTLAFVMMGLVLVVWLYFNSPEPQPQVANQSDTTLVTKRTTQEPITDDETTSLNKTDKNLATSINENSADPTTDDGMFASTDLEENIITIETDLVKLELTSKGGKIRKYYLKKYQTWYYDNYEESDFYNRHVQLINQTNGGDLDVVFITQQGKLVNTSKLDFTTDANNYYYKISGSDSLQISYSYNIDDEKVIRKNFTLFGNNYRSKFDVELINMNTIIGDRRYDVEWASGVNFLELNSVDEATYANALAALAKEYLIALPKLI